MSLDNIAKFRQKLHWNQALAKKKVLEVPFDVDGHMLYTRYYDRFGKSSYRATVDQWKPNSVFRETIRFVDIVKINSGRSAIRFLDNLDKTQWMFEDEFKKIIPLMTLGIYEGEFTYRTRIGYYSLMPILPEIA